MPSIIFYDPKPTRVIDHDLPGIPCVSIEMQDGFKFGFHLQDLATLDRLIDAFDDAREKLVAQYAKTAVDMPVTEVQEGDLLFVTDQVFKVARSAIWNDGVRIVDTLGVSFGVYKRTDVVQVVRHSLAAF